MNRIFLSLVFSLFIQAVHAKEVLPFNAYIVTDEKGQVLHEKNSDSAFPIASLTKLMTAYTVLQSNTPLDKVITISTEDIDTLKHSRSRIEVGTEMTVKRALELALVSSENRAAHALGRNNEKGIQDFIETMNANAKLLGMKDTVFVDPTGLSPDNRSSAKDLAILIEAAEKHSLIRTASNTDSFQMQVKNRQLTYNNSNLLVKSGSLAGKVLVSKTGFTSEAGRCIALKARDIHGNILTLIGLGAGNMADRTHAMRKVFGLSGYKEARPQKSETVSLKASKTKSNKSGFRKKQKSKS